MVNTREITAEYRLTHWAQVINERAPSGLSIKAYCRQIGIAANTYFYWQKKLREAACEQLSAPPVVPKQTALVPSGFAEVKVMPSTHRSPKAAVVRPSQIRVEDAGVKISTDSAYPLENLAALLRELTRP